MEENHIDPDKFSTYFMHKYDRLINQIARRYAIPNRYDKEDIKQYISERIVHIITSRDKKNNIEDPEKYFRSCLEFYCIEYQRMHGFVFDLPKRPRRNCEEDEKNARALGFKYLKDLTSEEINDLYVTDTLESNVGEISEGWSYLTGIVTKEEADILDCVFRKSMTWKETSIHLGVAQSTCWFRNNRALEKIKDYVQNLTGNVNKNILGILRNGTD